MSCFILALYFAGLFSAALVDGYTRDCNFNQTILAKEGSTTPLIVNFTHGRLSRLEMTKTSGYFPGPVFYIKFDADKDFNKTSEIRVNISSELYSDDIRSVQIELNNASMKDNGTYKLRNLREIACFTLFVLHGPSDPLKLVPRTKHHYLVSGDILPNITCTSECNPPCNISWGEYSDSSILSLGAVTTEDTGEYTCTATRADGQVVEQTISIYVAVRPSHQLLLVPAQIHYHLVTGDTIPDITCTSDCNPSCNISWEKHNTGSTLSLGVVTTEDTGEYTCTATRSDGRIVKRSISILVNSNSYFIPAITYLGSVQALTIFVLGIFICFVCKRRRLCCCYTHKDSKKNQPGGASVSFSDSAVQVSKNKNYEELTDGTRNTNNIYSGLT